jgi:hypothetical protein
VKADAQTILESNEQAFDVFFSNSNSSKTPHIPADFHSQEQLAQAILHAKYNQLCLCIYQPCGESLESLEFGNAMF